MRKHFKIDIELNGSGITCNSDNINLHLYGYVYNIFEYDNGSIMVKVFKENGTFIKSVEIDATDHKKILDELFSKVK